MRREKNTINQYDTRETHSGQRQHHEVNRFSMHTEGKEINSGMNFA